MILTRRRFFSFFGTGVVLAAKPELLLPSPRMRVTLEGPPTTARIPWGPSVVHEIYHLWWDKNQALWRIYR